MTSPETREERDEREVRALLDSLRATAPPGLPPARAQAVWGQISRRMSDGVPWRAWRLLLWPAVAGVAAVTALFVLGQPQPVTRPRGAEPIARSRPQVTDPKAIPAIVRGHERLPSGAEIEVGAGEVAVATATATDTELRLERGQVESRVPHLPPGGRYRVITPVAEVAVHGTRFVVTSEAGGETRVQVSEGVVSVTPRDWRPKFELHPGESRTVVPCPTEQEAARRGEGGWRCEAAALLIDADAAGESLARQNALVRAGRLLGQNAPDEAAAVWQRLRDEAPGGPHAEEAAFRAGEALHRAGRDPEARQVGETFRRDFPQSPYVDSTRDW